MRPATEEARYEYDLNAQSVVVDCGGFHGDFAHAISMRYDCHVLVFEPIPEFQDMITAKIAGRPKIALVQAALAGTTRTEDFHVQNDSTGIFAGSTTVIRCLTVSVKALMDRIQGDIALLKLNCEGMEYEILESMLDNNLIHRIKNLQVQFHWCAPNAKDRYASIRERLNLTHDLTWGDDPSIWLNFRRK